MLFVKRSDFSKKNKKRYTRARMIKPRGKFPS